MSVKVTKTKEIVAGDFDWSAYEDGWNGLSLHVNKKVKNNDKRIKVYCHEAYAQDLLNQYTNQAAPVSKELKKNTLVKIDGFRKIDENHVSASINGGANNISIDLNKEGKFFNNITLDDTKLTKETFLQLLDDPDVYKKFIDMGLVAKIGTDVEKGSIWDGYVESLVAEMQEQITKKNKAYVAKLVSSNNGGFVVEIAGMVKAFMPGSMAAANKINNYESLVGTEMEVMVESYDSKFGFIVSRKKYLRTIVPIYLKNLEAQLKENKDTMLEVTVTGTTAKWVDDKGGFEVKAGTTPGVVELTFKNQQTDVTYKFYVKVVVPANSIQIVGGDNKPITTGLVLQEGDEYTLGLIKTPANTTDSISWYSSDSSIVSVTQQGDLKVLKYSTEHTLQCTCLYVYAVLQ